MLARSLVRHVKYHTRHFSYWFGFSPPINFNKEFTEFKPDGWQLDAKSDYELWCEMEGIPYGSSEGSIIGEKLGITQAMVDEHFKYNFHHQLFKFIDRLQDSKVPVKMLFADMLLNVSAIATWIQYDSSPSYCWYKLNVLAAKLRIRRPIGLCEFIRWHDHEFSFDEDLLL